jgi:hypothetical protein
MVANGQPVDSGQVGFGKAPHNRKPGTYTMIFEGEEMGDYYHISFKLNGVIFI